MQGAEGVGVMDMRVEGARGGIFEACVDEFSGEGGGVLVLGEGVRWLGIGG